MSAAEKSPRRLRLAAIDRYPIRWTGPTIACAKTLEPKFTIIEEWVAFLDRIEDGLARVRRQAPASSYTGTVLQ